MNKAIRICQLLSLINLATLQLHPMLRSSRFLSQLRTPPQGLTILPKPLLIGLGHIYDDLAKRHDIAPVNIDPNTYNSQKSIAQYDPSTTTIRFEQKYIEEIPTIHYLLALRIFFYHLTQQTDNPGDTHFSFMLAYMKYCPTCMAIMLNDTSSKAKRKQGYKITDKTLKELTYHHKIYCKAHNIKRTSASKLDDIIKEGLPVATEELKDVCRLDRECGPIIKRHTFDVIEL